MDLFEALNSKKFKNLVNLFNSKEFKDSFEKAPEEEMSHRKSNSEIYNDIVNYYFLLLDLLKIDSFNSFRFPDYEDCRRVNVNEVEYDFDNCFCHDDLNATDALCSIDSLIADIEEISPEENLKK